MAALKGWQRANNHAVEPETRFATRMSKVQEYINSSDFRAKDGGGLDALAKVNSRAMQSCVSPKGGAPSDLSSEISLPSYLGHCTVSEAIRVD